MCRRVRYAGCRVAWAAAMVAALFVAAEPALVAGSAPETAAPVLRLGEMLVSDSASDRNLLQTLTLESASLEIATSTVESAEIRLQDAGTWADALDYSTGILTERRGRKEKTLTSFRGQIYPYPDFALNGVWQRSFWEVPSFLPAAAIERVEVLRSGGAIMVGPNAGLVGAVNIVPRRFDEPTTLLDVQGGSHGSYRESLVHGDRLERGYYTVGASRYSTDGPDDENAAERFGSLFGTTGLEPVPGLHLELTGFYLSGANELRLSQPPGQAALASRYEQYDPYTSYGGSGRLLLEHSDDASTEIDLGYARREGDFSSLGRPADDADENDWEYNAGIIHAHNLSDANTLRFGFQYNHWICPDGKRSFVGRRMDVETGSLVVVDEHRFDRLTLDAGARLTESWYEDYTDTTFNLTGTNLNGRPIEDEWGEPVLLGTLGAKYELSEPLSLYGHLALGTVEAPPGAVAEPGDDLTREQRTLIDAGFQVEKERWGRARLGAFAVLRDDAIILSNTKANPLDDSYPYENSDVRQYGLETELRSPRLCHLFTAYVTGTLMDSRQRGDHDWENRREIPDVVCTAGIYATSGPFDVNLFGKYVSRYENFRFAQDKQYHDLGDFIDLNLTAGVSLGKDKATRVYCSLKNLLDDEYSTVVGYPDYGFQAFVGLQQRF